MLEAPVAAPNLLVAADNTVAADAPCRKCAYNLRALPITGRCPECGAPVGLSIMGDLLRFADPPWVRGLARGTRLLVASICLAVTTTIVSYSLRFVGTGYYTWLLLLSIPGAILFFIGAWLLTEPDPSGIGEDQYGTVRRVIRILLAIAIASALLAWFRAAVSIPLTARNPMMVISMVAAFCNAAGHIAQLNYLSRIARRIPDDRLARRARFLMWAVGTCDLTAALVSTLIFIFIVLRSRTPGTLSTSLYALFMIPMLIALVSLIFRIMYLVMLTRFARRFREEAEHADAIWASAA